MVITLPTVVSTHPGGTSIPSNSGCATAFLSNINIYSGGQHAIQFFQNGEQLRAEYPHGGEAAATCVELARVEVVRGDGEVDADELGDAVEPPALVEAEAVAGALLGLQPVLVASAHRLGEGDKLGVGLHGVAHQRDEVGQHALGAGAAHAVALDLGIRLPQRLRRAASGGCSRWRARFLIAS